MPRAAVDGIYVVADACAATTTFSSSTLHSYCDMTTDEGKWTLIQRRIDATVNFNRTWAEYVQGFGDISGEFWYGLERIHCLTTREAVDLRIELGYSNETEPTLVYEYKQFSIGNAQSNYQLLIGSQTVIKGDKSFYDPMIYHNRRTFSAYDRGTYANCARSYGSGWWFYSCHRANLNGKYPSQKPASTSPGFRISWAINYSPARFQDFTSVQMKIRPHNCRPSACY